MAKFLCDAKYNKTRQYLNKTVLWQQQYHIYVKTKKKKKKSELKFLKQTHTCTCSYIRKTPSGGTPLIKIITIKRKINKYS